MANVERRLAALESKALQIRPSWMGDKELQCLTVRHEVALDALEREEAAQRKGASNGNA